MCYEKQNSPIVQEQIFYSKLLNLLVTNAETIVLSAPMKRQTEIAFGPVGAAGGVTLSSAPNSRLLPGSSRAKTIMEMKVPTNCGSVLYTLRIPK